MKLKFKGRDEVQDYMNETEASLITKGYRFAKQGIEITILNEHDEVRFDSEKFHEDNFNNPKHTQIQYHIMEITETENLMQGLITLKNMFFNEINEYEFRKNNCDYRKAFQAAGENLTLGFLYYNSDIEEFLESFDLTRFDENLSYSEIYYALIFEQVSRLIIEEIFSKKNDKLAFFLKY